MTKVDTRPLAAFLRTWRAFGENAYEPSSVLYGLPLSLVFGRRKPRRLLMITKGSVLSWIAHEMDEFPEHWAIIQRHGLPGPPHIEEVATLSRRLDLPIGFVGDLTPFALHVFLEYHRHLTSRRVRLEWIGIDQAWLELCRARVRRRFNFDSIPSEMFPIERDHFQAVAAAASWLEQVIGEEPWRLMANGKRLHLEAACGEGFYGPGIHEEIVKLLDRHRGKRDRRTAK